MATRPDAPVLQSIAAELPKFTASLLPGTHALPWEPGWERLVSVVHRWLVQTLAEALLLPPADEDA